MTFKIYVPADGVKHDVKTGSAIVGEEKGGMIDTHFEGGGASNVQTYEQKLHQAAGRRAQNYPTSARRSWNATDLKEVGSAQYSEGLRHWIVHEISDETSFRSWIGSNDKVTPGGSDELLVAEGTRRFSNLPVQEQARISTMRLPMEALCAEIVRSYEITTATKK